MFAVGTALVGYLSTVFYFNKIYKNTSSYKNTELQIKDDTSTLVDEIASESPLVKEANIRYQQRADSISLEHKLKNQKPKIKIEHIDEVIIK